MLDNISIGDAQMYFEGGQTVHAGDGVAVVINNIAEERNKDKQLMARCALPLKTTDDWSSSTALVPMNELVLAYPPHLGYFNSRPDSVHYVTRTVNRTVRKLLGQSAVRIYTVMESSAGDTAVLSRRRRALRPSAVRHFFNPQYRPVSEIVGDLFSATRFCEAASLHHCFKYTPALDCFLVLCDETPVGYLESENRIKLFPKTRDYLQSLESLVKGAIDVSI